jgi:hypothetical protein
MNVRSIAADYLRRNWSIVPIPFRAKAPVIDAWQNLRIVESELDHFFPARQNVGVLLGQPSVWLIDIDLDHELALKLAPSFLPLTGAIFARASKRRSHWLYYASQPVATRQWRLADRKMVVELRSTGGQTIFPPSVHPNGEPIEWDIDGEPAVVDPLELEAQLERIYREVASQVPAPPKPRPARTQIELNAPRAVLDRATRYLAKLPPAIAGQGGHDATFRAACTLAIGFGLERGQTLALLREWNETHCQPTWNERELEHKVDDALKQPGWRGHLLTGQRQARRTPASTAIERANRHAVEHRRRARRRAHA